MLLKYKARVQSSASINLKTIFKTTLIRTIKVHGPGQVHGQVPFSERGCILVHGGSAKKKQLHSGLI